MDFNNNTLDLFFKKNKIIIDEGSCGNVPNQYNELIKLCKQTNPLNIMEIGFNAGHSSELFLNNSNAYIYSFDIGDHFNSYLKYGKMFINRKFPNRHTLIFGDSRESVIKFHNNIYTYLS
jgi:hypothetical protein